jgi:2-oxoisovalerate dehydrogenase E1 component
MNINIDNYYKEALLIRRVEETFLSLFSKGKLNGTVHTCVGQEFSAIAFAGQLDKNDFVFSNHRCHGHFISFTKDYRGLMAELMGKRSGVCGGIGSSQHLCKDNFYSNGIQGGITPVAAGMALAKKLLKKDNIGILFIGDGTLGQGVLYETMNIISKWELPLLIVLENNAYAQSTPIEQSLAGEINDRPKAFNIKTFTSDTWDIESLMNSASTSINYVRENNKPAFHLVNTYRLNAHSKGDDNRSKDEIAKFSDFNISISHTDSIAIAVAIKNKLDDTEKGVMLMNEITDAKNLSLNLKIDKAMKKLKTTTLIA